jgi:hypothetical protein
VSTKTSPQHEKIQREDWYMLIATIVGGLLIAPLLTNAPFPGFDWVVSFSQRINDVDYPPWVCLMLRPLTALPPRTGLVIIQGLALSSVSLLTYRIARRTFPDNRLPAVIGVILVLASPYPWMLFWTGQIEAVVIIGMMAMPFSIPLLFAKPNLGPWVVFRSRRDILWTIGFVLVSFVIWGLWPVDQFHNMVIGRTHHVAAIGWRNLHPSIGLLGILLFLLTDRDQWRLMAAGSLIMPYVMPYHYFMLLPSIGRVGGWRQVLLWLVSSVVGIIGPNYRTVEMKALELLFPILVWVLLAPSLRPKELWEDPDLIWRRGLRFAQEMWNKVKDMYSSIMKPDVQS